MTDRRRNTLILLLVAGLIAASAVVIASKKTRLGLDLKGGVELVYQAKPTAQSKVDSESLNRAIDIMRSRVDKLGVAQPEIQRSGSDEIDVALPEVTDAKRAEQEVGKTAQLFFYDWEPNVIGAGGQPAPTEATATGGRQAGAAQFGLPEYQAVLRAEKRARRTAQDGHDLEQRLHAAAGRGMHLRQLVPARHQSTKRCCSGPRKPKRTCSSEKLQARPAKRQGGARQPRHGARPLTPDRRRWRQGHEARTRTAGYVIKDNPVLTGADVKNPQQSFDEGAAARARRTSRSTSPGTARASSSRRPRKSPTAARKRSCRASARKRPSSTSRSCSTGS